MKRYYQRFRVRGYARRTVTVGERTETHWEYQETETGIIEEGADALRLAMIRNSDLLSCDRFDVDTWPAFVIDIREKAQDILETRRRFRLRRQDPSYNKDYDFRNLGPYWEDPENWF